MVPATTGCVPASPWSIPAGEWVQPATRADVGTGPKLTASEADRSQFTEKMEKSVAALEVWLGSASAQNLEPGQYGFVRAQARLMLAQCDVVVAAMQGGIEPVDATMRQRLEDLGDRLDEIVDTLGWSAEAAAPLVSLIREELCE